MNSLSLLLYLADFVSSFGAMAKFFTVISAFLLIIYFIAQAISYSEDEVEEFYKFVGKNTHRWLLAIFVTCAMLTNLVPSRQTILMIAASEYGEKIVTSETTKSVVSPAIDLLKEYIAKELKKLHTEK